MKSLRYVLPLLALVALVACGSSEGAGAQQETIQKVTATEQIFSIDDFDGIDFKISKEYDVEGLTAATGAWFGFWKPPGSPAKEFEIRFYPSHADAIEFGTSFAEDGAGANAILDPEEARWDEGVKDRRYFFAGQIGTHGSGSVQPKYGGYIIYGNMILLCEGANPEHSLDRCSDLVSAVGSIETQ